ncbi:MAG TPA: protein kinase, partial [Candidatus Krumholzibacteria bacterium]|nr:protein kinase [Candidatus Krumholzibacteria bacterium]
MIGRSIAHYEITARIGAGGMGEVYRARDSRLGRDVALKVLPDIFAQDPERLMRFEREARLLASLNHTGIATIHGIEHDGTRRVLVMELVDGDDLSVRIARGAVPLDETLAIARQIADALEAAHDQGVVHRDLKPANVVVTADGAVRVLDFGLAKAIEGDASNSGLSHSPTMLGSSPTAAGVILGTAAYMSPEQARGKRVDRRADIFAFGCVLFEMLTARQAFGGETVSDTLAAVLRAEPDWSALPADTPPAIRTLLRRCLEKDPRQRLRDIGEARILIEKVIAGETGEAAVADSAAPAPRSRPWLVLALAGLLVACAAGWFFTAQRPAQTEKRVVTASIVLPEETPMSVWGSHPGPPALSPDGKHVAFAVVMSSGPRLAVRDLASDEIRTFTGTDGAGYPFWSYDGRQIGYFADGKLRKVDLTGGVPTTLCDAEVGKGGAWTADGNIIFAPSYATPIHRVSANGGISEAITQLDSTRNESSHRFPYLLPDGKHFLYVVRNFGGGGSGGHTLRVANIDGTTVKDLFATETNAAYAGGYLFFIREAALIAQPFDLKTLSLAGDPMQMATQVQLLTGAAHGVFDVSETGVAVYRQGEDSSERLLFLLDGNGRELKQVSTGDNYDTPVRFSPDGRSLLTGIFSGVGGTADLWLLDIERGTRTRLTFDPGHENGAAWSPDGTRIAFVARRDGVFRPFVKRVVGDPTETPATTGPQDIFLAGWSRDGRYLLGHELGGGPGSGQGHLIAIPLQESGAPDPLAGQQLPPSLGGVGGLYRITFSPDGMWMA